MIEAEAGDRRARNMVFAPIAPLCAAAGPFSGLSFPPRALALIWKALKADYPDEVAAAKDLAAGWGGPDSHARALRRALRPRRARACAPAGGPFGAAATAADQGGGRAALAACLDIAPVTRRALDQMPQWLGRMTSEKAAKLRLAYRDAVAIADDAGPRFFEMLAAHLAEPWLILRVISGVMDRPGEAYVSGSELASFGERVLGDIERRLGEVTAFKSTAGRPAAHAAAQAVHRRHHRDRRVRAVVRPHPGRRLGPAPGAPEEDPGDHHRGPPEGHRRGGRRSAAAAHGAAGSAHAARRAAAEPRPGAGAGRDAPRPCSPS